MRVAIVNEHVSACRGGAETSTVEMAAALRRLGADVTLIAAAGGANSAGSGQAQATPDVVTCGSPTGSRSARTRAFIRAAAEMCGGSSAGGVPARDGRAAGFDAGFDIVHAVTPIPVAHVYQPRGGTYVETIERSIARGAGPLTRALRRLGRRFNRRQQFLMRVERDLLTGPRGPIVAAVSEYVRRQVIAAYGVAEQRVRVVFNGVSVRPLPPGDAAKRRSELRERWGVGSEPLALFVAHNFRLKGLAELIRAAAMPFSAWMLLVAGRDRPAPFLRLARRLGIADRVRFVHADVPVASLYAAADVLAHPTWYDPCSRVVLEALCCGLPVVTTRLNGAAEAMTPPRHGVVIGRPDDVSSLAAAVRTALRREVRETCQADAGGFRERLSMDRHARELLVLYEQVAARR